MRLVIEVAGGQSSQLATLLEQEAAAERVEATNGRVSCASKRDP